MKKKKVFYSEFCYAIGLLVLAVGTAFMEKADFGMSMVVAPAYLIHLKVSKLLPWFSFGMSEIIFQAFILIIIAIMMRKVKRGYFLSFATAFIYGMILDGAIMLVSLIPFEAIAFRIVFFAFGLISSSIGIAFLFHTYFPLESYEVFVQEAAEKFNTSIGKVKTIYDLSSCALSIALSFIFFGGFVGISFGTVICAVVNGFLIEGFSRLIDKIFVFKDGLPLKTKLK